MNAGTGTLGNARDRVLRFAASENARGAALSLGLKTASSVANLIMLTLLARAMGPHEFGILAVWLNGLSFLAVIAGAGQERLILRSWNEFAAARDWGRARGALFFGFAVTVVGAVVAALAVLLFGILRPPADPLLPMLGALFVLAQAIYFYNTHATRAVVGILRSDIHDVTWRTVVIGVAVAALASGQALTSAGMFGAASAGLVAVIAVQLATIGRLLPRDVRAARIRTESRAWTRRSAHMATGTYLEAAAQYLEVLIIGLVLSPVEAGGYFAASRVASVFAMITSGFNSFATREIPRRHFGDGHAGLSSTLRHLALITAMLVLVGLVAVLAFGSFILSLFGSAFATFLPVLVALAVGASVTALAGPAPVLLLSTGHERAYSILLACSLTARFGALIACAAAYGPLGGAVASAAAAIVTAVALTLACRRLVGVDPSITDLVGRRAA